MAEFIKMRLMPGLASLFRGKIRKPVSVTFTPAHHEIINAGMERLNLTRSDFLGLLVEKYGKTVTIE